MLLIKTAEGMVKPQASWNSVWTGAAANSLKMNRTHVRSFWLSWIQVLSKVDFLIQIPSAAMVFHRHKHCKWQIQKVNLVERESFHLLTNFFQIKSWKDERISDTCLLPIYRYDLFGAICPYHVIGPVSKSKLKFPMAPSLLNINAWVSLSSIWIRKFGSLYKAPQCLLL